jgi:hypothetical protein
MQKAGHYRPFILFFLFFLGLVNRMQAQNPLENSDQDLIEYVRYIEIDATDSMRIWDSVVLFASDLKSPGKLSSNTIIDDYSGSIKAHFGFYLYQNLSFIKQVDGAVFAEMNLLYANNQISSIIRNIYFIDYARDRYGKFSPSSSKRYALEDLIKKRKNEIWKQHFRTIDENMNSILSNLEKSIREIKEVSAD